MPPAPSQIPLWLKIAWTALVCVIVPVYVLQYPLSNFLWFSNVAMLAAVPALWLESRLLASMQAVSVALLEMFWIADFTIGMLLGDSPIGLAEYMFDQTLPLVARTLSLYHLPLPFLLLVLVCRLGYDRRGWLLQTAAAWVLFPLSYLLSNPERNVNWAFGLGEAPQEMMHPLLYLALLMLAAPLLVYLPTHLLLVLMAKHLPGCRRMEAGTSRAT